MIAQSYISKLKKNSIQKREQRRYFKYIVRMLDDLLNEKDEASNEIRQIICESRLIEFSVRYMAKNTYPDLSIVKRIVGICIGILGKEKSQRSIQDKFQHEFERIENISCLFRVLHVPIEE
jgi:hypothetical protein